MPSLPSFNKLTGGQNKFGDKKICVKECDTSLKCQDPAGCCETGYECSKVTMDITKNGVSTGISGPTYSYCMPKK